MLLEILNIVFYQKMFKSKKEPRSQIVWSCLEQSLGKNVTLKRAIIGENAVIGDDAVIDGTDEIAVIGYSEVIGVTIDEN